MKVELTITLELPSDLDSATDPELRQILFDEYINTVVNAHLSRSLNNAEQAAMNTNPRLDKLYETAGLWQRQWIDVCRHARWDFRRITETETETEKENDPCPSTIQST